MTMIYSLYINDLFIMIYLCLYDYFKGVGDGKKSMSLASPPPP